MVVIVLVVPSSTNGHNSDKSETIHHANQYDINNNHDTTSLQWSFKNEIAKTYDYAARDYRKSNNIAGGSSKKDNRRFINNSKFYNYNNNNGQTSSYKNSFVKSDACNNNNNKNSCTSKNYARHITRITISDDFSQTEIGSDQLAEAVTKEGKFCFNFYVKCKQL